jgi:hypothetical protein
MFFRHHRILRLAGRELCKTALIPGAPVVIAGLIGAIGLAGLIYLKKKAEEERSSVYEARAKAAAERARREEVFEEENIFDEEPVIHRRSASKAAGTKKTSKKKPARKNSVESTARSKRVSPKPSKTKVAEAGRAPKEEAEVPYVDMWVANARTKKFHVKGCGDIGKIGKANLEDIAGSLDELLERGYIPCSKCVGKR